MHYIIVDLEWNQPMSYQSQVFRQVGDKLLFEMIQVGAVKLNDQLEVVDKVSIPIKPTHYTKIHPRIRRMTKLGEEEFENAPAFTGAMDQFFAWCGDKYALLTWGCDDVSVWKQNMDFFKYPAELPPLCDIQRLYSEALDLGKERKGLKAAMEQLEIEAQEDKNFHNALHDAFYTALVFQKLPNPENVLKYINEPKKLSHVERARRSRHPAQRYESMQAAFQSEVAFTPKCPMCGKLSHLEAPYVRQSGDKYLALSTCPSHGTLFTRLRFSLVEKEQVAMSASVALATAQAKAYVHTKELQWQQKVELGVDAKGDLEELWASSRSSMPFEE